MKIEINDTNYSQFKKIFEIIYSHVRKRLPSEILNEESNPVTILNRWEQKSRSMAKRGLKIGLQDLISSIKEFPVDARIAIDNDLVANQLPVLRDLQGIVQKTIARALKRQQIRTLEEFYMIKEEVIDQGSDLKDDDRALLDKLLADFKRSTKFGM